MTTLAAASRRPRLAALSAHAAIARGAAWIFMGRVASQALSVLFTVALARRLGVLGFGQYAYIAAVVYVANVATTFGTDMVVIRDVAAGRVAQWKAALVVQLGLSWMAILAIWIVAPIAPGLGSAGSTALRLYAVALIPAAVYSVATAILRGRRRMREYAGLGTVLSGLQLGVVVSLVEAGPAVLSLPSLAAGLVAAQSMTALVAVMACAWPPAVSTSPSTAASPAPAAARSMATARVRMPDVRQMLRASLPIGVVGWLGMLYQRAPILLLAALSGPLGTGLYAGASRIVEASKAGHVALLGALYPAMADDGSNRGAARHHRGRTDDRSRMEDQAIGASPSGRPQGAPRVRREVDWWLRPYLIGAGLLSVALVAGGPTLIGVLYGPSFAASAAPLAILAVSIIPSTAATYRSLEFVATHREASALRAQAASLAVLAVLLVGLVPAFGIVGGASAVLAAELVQLVVLLLEARRAPRARSAHAGPLYAGPMPARVASAVSHGNVEGTRA